MLKYICVLLISLSAVCYCQDSVTDGTELLLTFLVHRHGDRTPIESTMFLSNDVEALEAATARYGYGQLTDNGRRRAYQLGQFLRRRYDGLLSPAYNRSEIYIRSTDSTRAKMTVLSAMAAVYPALEDNWSADVNWTPVPYTTVPAKYDFNQGGINCPAVSDVMFSEGYPAELAQYTDVLEEWTEISGYNVSAQLLYAVELYDVYVSQKSLGIPLDPRIEAIFPQIEEIAGLGWEYMYSNETNIFEAGVLLYQFFTVADQIIAGEDVQRVQVYSAHDANVFSFEGVTRVVKRQGAPKYASMYALELRQVIETGEYVVVPVYLNTPSEDVITYLDITGCGSRCEYESFRSITADYRLDEDTWRTKCGFSEDMEIDTSSVD
ncbi:prostatic acid phosphatase [Helicoverpa armigera]|uniref:prostatic acid phosphatase n=1 Tax=Helicoverpa armigera TaxID=29058 RepID=UPI0030835693